MSNENEVYIIEDIHPRDAWYEERKNLIGKKVTKVKFDNYEYIPGWKGTRGSEIVEGRPEVGLFFAVKLSPYPKKSFWQKLFTWSW